MAKYRKKPVVIEAERFWPPSEYGFSVPPVPEGVTYPLKHITNPPLDNDSSTYLALIDTCPSCGWRFELHGDIKTLEGSMLVCPGDMIITGEEGEKYPCKPDIFSKTYEPIN